MIDLKNMNDNIIANRWKERYAKLPQEIKEKLEVLRNSNAKDYQLQVIKRKRSYPEIGDVFQINPKGDILLQGVVVNNHINNINGEDLLLVLIFKPEIEAEVSLNKGVTSSELLISPIIVGKEYWTRGYFYTVANNKKVENIKNVGFYNIGKRKFVDEYGKEMLEEPPLLGSYGVATITGVAREINQELIISGIL